MTITFTEYTKMISEGKISKELAAIKKKYKKDLDNLFLHEFDDKLRVDFLVVKSKNSGIGSKVMQDICDYADKANKIVILSSSDEFGSDKERLTKFYERFGFVRNEGDNHIFGIFETMYRKPHSKGKI